MKRCKTCVAKCNGAGKAGVAPDCTYYKEEEKKAMTNADRIRQMSNEELVDFIATLSDCCLAKWTGSELDCSHLATCDSCDRVVRRWLQREVNV